jgi:hypothetical protein
MDWKEYLDHCLQSYPEDIALFPHIDEEADTSQFREKLRKARFRWLKECYEEEEREAVFRSWQSATDALITEREVLGGPLWEFYHSSDWLFLYMLRGEPGNLQYYKALRDAIALRADRESPVVFLGPTAGAEPEAIEDAYGIPVVVSLSSDAKWVPLLEERLIHDSLDYRAYTYDDFARERPETRFVVLSNFIPDASAAMKIAFNCLETHGFVLFHSANELMVTEAESLGMIRRTDNSDPLAVYFKHRGISPGVANVRSAE